MKFFREMKEKFFNFKEDQKTFNLLKLNKEIIEFKGVKFRPSSLKITKGIFYLGFAIIKEEEYLTNSVHDHPRVYKEKPKLSSSSGESNLLEIKCRCIEGDIEMWEIIEEYYKDDKTFKVHTRKALLLLNDLNEITQIVAFSPYDYLNNREF